MDGFGFGYGSANSKCTDSVNGYMVELQHFFSPSSFYNNMFLVDLTKVIVTITTPRQN
jgi:hypothetical protein